VAKMALIERELKRDKLVAKYAAKHAELKAIAGMQSAAMKSVQQHVWLCKNFRVTQTRRGSATVARSPVVHAVPSASSVWVARRFVKWHLQAISQVSSRQAGNRQEI